MFLLEMIRGDGDVLNGYNGLNGLSHCLGCSGYLNGNGVNGDIMNGNGSE